jgi:hypothetical protein
MNRLPPREVQIVQAHSALIHRVVQACQNRTAVPDLEEVLRASAEKGWTAMVRAVRQILAGRRDPSLLGGLDDEDRVIVQSILRGLQDPSSLPPLQSAGDPTMAAPGLAAMLNAAASGDTQALKLVAGMAEQMSRAGGDMARLAAIIRPLVNGEGDAEKLCKGMSAQGRNLVLSILEELARLRPH